MNKPSTTIPDNNLLTDQRIIIATLPNSPNCHAAIGWYGPLDGPSMHTQHCSGSQWTMRFETLKGIFSKDLKKSKVTLKSARQLSNESIFVQCVSGKFFTEESHCGIFTFRIFTLKNHRPPHRLPSVDLLESITWTCNSLMDCVQHVVSTNMSKDPQVALRSMLISSIGPPLQNRTSA